MSSDYNHSPAGPLRTKSCEIAPVVGISSSAELKGHRRRNSTDVSSKQAVFPPQMTTKVKGLFKGFKCISQIFDPNEREPEMQIGYPMDVKHVAHIGCDGSSLNQPSWMNEFQQAPELSSAAPREFKGQHSPTKKTSGGSRRGSRGIPDSQNKDIPELPKPSTRHRNQDSSNDDNSNAPKSSRRRHSSSNIVVAGEESDVLKQPRRHSHKLSSSGLGSPPKDKESSVSSKHGRKKKSTKSADGCPSRSSRSKAQSAACSAPNIKNSEDQLPALKPKGEEI